MFRFAKSTAGGPHLLLRSLAVPTALAALLLGGVPGLALADGGTISGTVVAPGGSGMGASNVQVTLLGAPSPYGWGNLTTTTDWSGQFSFQVSDGIYGLSFTGNGSCGVNYRTYIYTAGGKVAAGAQPAPITVSGSNVGGITLNCPTLYSISGTVVAPNGPPPSATMLNAEFGENEANAQANPDGSFSISGLEAGSYLVSVFDCYPFQSGWIGAEGGFVQSRDWAKAFTVGPNHASNIQINLATSPSISGTVTTPDGQAAAGMNVVFGTGPGMTSGNSTTTAADGTFTLQSLVPSTPNDIYVFDPNSVYMPVYWSLKGATPDRAHANEVSVDGGSVANVNLQLTVGRSISGTVVDRGSSPISGASVSEIPYLNGTLDFSASSPQSVTGPDGSFHLTGLAPGAYALSLWSPSGSGYYSASGVVTDSSLATPIQVGTADATDILVAFNASTYAVTGTLTGSDGGPIAWGTVVLDSGSGSSYGSSDSLGNFSISGVLPGKYLVHVSPPSPQYLGGYWTGSGMSQDRNQALTITVSSDTSLNLVAPLGEHITGRVTDKSGIPIGTNLAILATTTPYSESEDWAAPGSTSPRFDGTFDLLVPSGKYAILVMSGGSGGMRGYYSASSPGGFSPDWRAATFIQSTPTGGQNITLADPPAAVLSGRFLDSDGKPLTCTQGWIFTNGFSEWTSGVRADPAGNFSIALDPGEYKLLVGGGDAGPGLHTGGPVAPTSDGSYRAIARSQQGWYRAQTPSHFTDAKHASTIVVGTRDITNIVMKLPNTVGISGRVTVHRSALASIRVEALDGSGNVVAHTSTGADGTYSIIGLQSDGYLIRFSDPSGLYATGYYSKKGTVSSPKKATTVKVDSRDATGIDGTLALAS